MASGPISEKNIEDLKEADIEDGIATKIMQVYFVTLAGSACSPVGHFMTNGLSAEKMKKIFNDISESFKKEGFQIVGGSTDGFSGRLL